MFKPLTTQMRVVFNVAALITTAGMTWFLHSQGVIGGSFSWPPTLIWLGLVGFMVVGLRLFVQQADTFEDLRRLVFGKRRV